MVFLDRNFNYEPYLCNGCHDLKQKAMNFNDVAIVTIKGNDYRIHFWYMSKDDAMSIMNNCNLNEKAGLLFFHYIKNEWNDSISKKKGVILNGANDYYENNKEGLREGAKDKYRELSEEEKDIKSEYGRNKCNNMSEEKKQRLNEYQRN